MIRLKLNHLAPVSLSVIIQFLLLIIGSSLSPIAYAELSGNSTLSEEAGGTTPGQESNTETPLAGQQAVPSQSTNTQPRVSNDPPPCDIQDTACNSDGGPPPCDIQDTACNSDGGPPPCDIQDPTCTPPPPCDIQDPTCTPPPPCDIQDLTCQGCSPDDPACNPTHEICDNGGRDDDGDGFGDSVDPDCTGSTAPIENNCVDHIDNDHDGKTDGSDPDCGVGEGGKCGDGVDNDHDGLTDNSDPDCDGGGGPCSACLPGGAASTPLTNGPIGDPNILAAAFQNNLLAGPAEATSPIENICNDGIDNDHNSLTDSEDPTCSVSELSLTGPKTMTVSTISKIPTNNTENHKALELKVAGHSSNIVVISITAEGNRKTQDIRTISLHYKYTPEKITIGKDTKVMWLNNDPTQSHGINLLDRLSGKTVYSYPVIRPGDSAYYIFGIAGQYIYTDPKYLSMSGLITVLN